MLSIPIIDHMWINIGDAVRMYARLLRGSIRDAKVALAVADHLRARRQTGLASKPGKLSPN